MGQRFLNQLRTSLQLPRYIYLRTFIWLCIDKDLQAPIKWEPVDVTPQLKDGKTTIPEETIESIKKNKVALKGPLAVSQASPCGIFMLILADTYWKRPRIAESYSSSYFQPICKCSTLPLYCRLQDPLR